MPSSAKDTSNQESSIAARLDEQRQRSRAFIGAQRDRLKSLDDELTTHLSTLQTQTREWVTFQDQLTESHLDLQTQWNQLTLQTETLENRDQELQQREQALRQSRHDLADRIRRNRDRSRQLRAEADSALGENVVRLQQEIEQLQSEHQQQQKDRDTLLSAHQEQVELQTRLESELNAARGTLAEQRNEEKQLRQQLARSRTVLNERAQQITELRTELENALRAQEEKAAEQPQVDVGEFMQLRRERDELHEQVVALQQAQKQWTEQGGSESDLESLQHRYDILVDKVRELKNRNSTLETELKSWRGGASGAQSGESFDWEKQKRRMLNQLDGTPDEETTAEEAAQGGITIPPELFAVELESEREKLQKLQEEWHEKLRSAEVEISVERAENARLRLQLQEKMREVEGKMAAIEKQSEKETVSGKNKPRRRWMDRLGLSGDDE